jgi:hypothetical protein
VPLLEGERLAVLNAMFEPLFHELNCGISRKAPAHENAQKTIKSMYCDFSVVNCVAIRRATDSCA